MSFDHGLLNLPLAKRGDLNAQIDAHKASVARDAAAQRRAHAPIIAQQRPAARKLVDQLSAERLAEIATKAGLTPAKAKARLLSDAQWDSARLIALLGPIVAAQGEGK